MKHETDILGEFSVYPGHPTTIAYCIVNEYDNLDAALSRKNTYQKSFPDALANGAIPGGGGCVYSALDMLRAFRDFGAEVALEVANSRWRSERDNGYREKYEAGQAQAEKFQPQLINLLTDEWLGKENSGE